MDSSTGRSSANLQSQIKNYATTGSYSGGKTLGELGYKNGLPNLDTSDASLQAIAKAAYDHDPKVANFSFVPTLSTYEAKVFVKPGTDYVVVAFKGTDPSSINDIYTDIGLAAGHLSDSSRAARSRATIEAVRRAIPGARIVVTGHSLGGSLAREVSNEPGVSRAVGFNTGYDVPGANIALGTLGWRKGSKAHHKANHGEHPKFTDYLNTRDVVSMGAKWKRKDTHKYYTKSFGLGAHRPSFFK
jgi:Lipase (class 3)